MLRHLLAMLMLVSVLSAEPTNPDSIAKEILAPLLDPSKVATLKGDRPINARLYRVLYWVETARLAGGDPAHVVELAQQTAGYSNTPVALADKVAILWSRRKLEGFGCLNTEGMAKLRKGGSPTITNGEHSGDKIALDHVLPRAVVPELEAKYYNLEAVPSRQNLAKSAKIGKRELDLARRWGREGLLSTDGLKAIEAAAQ